MKILLIIMVFAAPTFAQPKAQLFEDSRPSTKYVWYGAQACIKVPIKARDRYGNIAENIVKVKCRKPNGHFEWVKEGDNRKTIRLNWRQ